jgi:hypothetical protein
MNYEDAVWAQELGERIDRIAELIGAEYPNITNEAMAQCLGGLLVRVFRTIESGPPRHETVEMFIHILRAQTLRN